MRKYVSNGYYWVRMILTIGTSPTGQVTTSDRVQDIIRKQLETSW